MLCIFCFYIIFEQFAVPFFGTAGKFSNGHHKEVGRMVLLHFPVVGSAAVFIFSAANE